MLFWEYKTTRVPNGTRAFGLGSIDRSPSDATFSVKDVGQTDRVVRRGLDGLDGLELVI